MHFIKMSSGAMFHGCCISAVGPTQGTSTLAALGLAKARAVTHPIPEQLLAEMGTFKLLSGYKKEIQRKSSFVLGADWFPFFLPSPTWKPVGNGGRQG